MKYPKLVLFAIDGVQASYVNSEIDAGRLPGFERLMKRGVSFGNMLSVFPSISPTCWNSVFTGALPCVHGATSDLLHVRGTHPQEFRSAYHSGNVRGERFWDMAAELGDRTLLITVLGSGPARSENVTHIMGNITTSPDKPTCDTDLNGIPQQYFSLRLDGEPAYQSGYSAHAVDPRYPNKSTSMSTWQTVCDGAACRKKGDSFVFDANVRHPRYIDHIEPFTWTVIPEKDGVRVGIDEESAKSAAVITPNSWSDVISREIVTGDGTGIFHFRAYLEFFDPENKILTVYITGVNNLFREIQPADRIPEIMAVPETHFICYDDFPKNPKKFFESFEFSLAWRRQIMLNAVERGDYEIIFDYNNIIDDINHHRLWKRIHGDEAAISDYRTAFSIMDRQISWLLDHIVGEDTVFAVISDHGGVGCERKFPVFEALEKAGLAVFDETGAAWANWRNDHVIWEKTKAYVVDTCYINVNLAGREPCGIVPPEEYDKTVAEIIRALHLYAETSNGVRGLAFAVPGDQALFFGHSPEDSGDVIFGIYGSSVGGQIGGVHAVQIPGSKDHSGSDLQPICVMCGKNFKENAVLTRPTDLTDIAPTLCHAVGYPQPKDATGGIVFAAYQDGR